MLALATQTEVRERSAAVGEGGNQLNMLRRLALSAPGSRSVSQWRRPLPWPQHLEPTNLQRLSILLTYAGRIELRPFLLDDED